MEATARRAVASGAQPAAAYLHLAQALAARGQSISTVREALSQSEQAFAAAPGVTAEEREKHALGRGVMLSLLAGDFEAAEKGVRAYEKLVTASRRQDDHGRVALVLGAVLEEQGRDKEAAGVALDFLDRRDAWEPNPGAEDIAMARDATPSLLVMALRGGRLTRAFYASRRADWLKGWTTRLTPVSKNFLWLHGWARAVDDAEGAREALAALPAYQPLPPFRPLTPVDLDVGRTYLLAGQAEQAIPWLAGFTRTCGVLEHPVEHLRAQLWLGRAREAKGDPQGACAAYRVVVDRWGQARPRSVTAEAAAERLAALRCGGPGARRKAGATPRPGGDDDDDEGPPPPPPPPP
jgi:serine/threonine-protein kinase